MRGLFVGDNVCLTAIKEADITIIEEWFNNVKFLRHYDMLPALPKSRRKLEEMIKSYEESDDSLIYAIRSKASGKVIGISGFFDIMWSNGTGTIFIGIGDEAFTGKGIGYEAMRLMIDFGFNELNLYRIQLNVISYNEPAIRLYEKLGFVKEGTYRELVFRDGKRYDLYLYGLLKNDKMLI